MGAAVGVEAKNIIEKERMRPMDASDVDSAELAKAEVARLRKQLHKLTSLGHQETKGLEAVFQMLSEGRDEIDVATLCQAHERLCQAPITEDDMRSAMNELGLVKPTADFLAFCKIFALRRSKMASKKSFTFADFDTEGKGVITGADIKRRVQPRQTFAGEFFDDAAVDEILVKCGSPKAGTVNPEHFKVVQDELNKRRMVYEAFKLWDSNNDGEVDIRDLLTTLRNNGEEVTMEEVQEIIQECDADHDGVINFKDFRAAIDRPSLEGAFMDRPSLSLEAI